jgi:hypothetical protein
MYLRLLLRPDKRTISVENEQRKLETLQKFESGFPTGSEACSSNTDGTPIQPLK